MLHGIQENVRPVRYVYICVAMWGWDVDGCKVWIEGVKIGFCGAKEGTCASFPPHNIKALIN